MSKIQRYGKGCWEYIFQAQKLNITISWGLVVWSSLERQVFKYDSNRGLSYALPVSDGVYVTPLLINQLKQYNTYEKELWNLVCSCTIWHIWKARCTRVIGLLVVPAPQVVQGIWLEMVTTLRARYENIKGESEAMRLKRIAFHALWKYSPFYVLCRQEPKWLYKAPKWLFPPPIT